MKTLTFEPAQSIHWVIDDSIGCADCELPGLRVPLVWNATNPSGEYICENCDLIGTLVKLQRSVRRGS